MWQWDAVSIRTGTLFTSIEVICGQKKPFSNIKIDAIHKTFLHTYTTSGIGKIH
jgi:hypothetical protein